MRAYFKDHEFGNTEFADLLAALERSSGRDLESWAQEWLQTSGVNTLAPEFELDDDGRYTSFAVRQTAHPDHPTLRRHRLGIGLYDEVDGRLVRRTSVEIDVDGELTEVADLVGQQQPDLLLLNDGDLAYAKIRLDERSLATVVGGLATLDDSLARALCWGAAWDMTRDAEMSATDFVAPGAQRHRHRDRRVRRRPDPRRTPPLAVDALRRAGQPGRAARRPGRRACASCSRTPSRAATTSCPSPAPTPPPRTATPRSPTSSGCSTAR